MPGERAIAFLGRYAADWSPTRHLPYSLPLSPTVSLSECDVCGVPHDAIDDVCPKCLEEIENSRNVEQIDIIDF